MDAGADNTERGVRGCGDPSRWFYLQVTKVRPKRTAGNGPGRAVSLEEGPGAHTRRTRISGRHPRLGDGRRGFPAPSGWLSSLLVSTCLASRLIPASSTGDFLW